MSEATNAGSRKFTLVMHGSLAEMADKAQHMKLPARQSALPKICLDLQLHMPAQSLKHL